MCSTPKVQLGTAGLFHRLLEAVRGTSLVVQWLRLCASNAGGTGLILDWGTRNSHAIRCTPRSHKKEKEEAVRVEHR